MELKQLQYFTTVVDEGSISAAAVRLHMSQPPLSTQMKLLEQELGVVLFERGARHILLTDAGRLLYGRAQSLLRMASAAKKELNNLHSGLRGILRLGLISSSGTAAVREKLMEFHALYPDVHFEILEGNTFELLEALKSREIEAALIRAPFSGDEALETCALCEEPMCAALTGDFPDELWEQKERELQDGETGTETEVQKELAITDLAGKPLILYRRWEKEIISAFQQAGIAPDVVMMADDARTSLMWAISGLGIALVPASFAAAFAVSAGGGGDRGQSGSMLRTYPLADRSLFSRLTIVKQKGGGSSRIVEQFFQVFTGGSSREAAFGPFSL